MEWYHYDGSDGYVEYYQHIMFILESKQKELRNYVSQGSFMVRAAGGAAIGGLLGGPGGAVIGATVGSVFGLVRRDTYSELQDKLKNKPNDKKRELVHAVQALVRSRSKAELNLYVEARSQQKQFIDCITKFT
ncbi:uncharacterized protein LOC128204221 [Mya arenaria]|uniref:uncharacterized protein LOC128204221 n=1 Tax=Mya arenaria TaxID=6604 RepID=UPI0022E8CE11|nr:uncharacterized protein LOC128204221 [Mya arenaria]